MLIYIANRERGKSFLMFILFCGILSMMCLEEEKDYSLEDLREYGQNEEFYPPLNEPSQEFEESGAPQNPIEPLIIHTNPGKESLYYYHLDHLGTPVKMTDENANIVWSMECSPFMEICSFTGEIIQPLRFPGQYYDEETGLHYNWHRYYKPDWGRYVEVNIVNLTHFMLPMDVIPFVSEEILYTAILYRSLIYNPQFQNPYNYADNAPINKIDPMGRVSIALPVRPSLRPLLTPDLCYKYALDIFNIAVHRWGRSDKTSDIRHCWASCEIARKCGSSFSNLLGWINEQAGRVSGGYDPRDFKANEKGRRCANGTKLGKSCEECCKSMLCQ